MSRIGKKPIILPKGVSASLEKDSILVSGAKGKLTVVVPKPLTIVISEDSIAVTRPNDLKQVRALHGLLRSLISNAVAGVTEGYKKTLKLVGTGYRVKAQGSGISLAVGYSHPIDVIPEEGVSIKVEGTDTIYIEGIDKQAVGQVAANIRKIRPPEPYKGKGIRYEDEVVRRKQGKAAA